MEDKMKMKKIRKTVILMLLVFVITLVSGNLNYEKGLYANDKEKLQKLKLAIGYIPHIQFAPLYVAIEKGYYKDEGIDLEIEYGFGIDIFSLLVSSKIDIGLSDSDQLIIAGNNGMKLKAFYQYYQSYPITIVAKRDKIKNVGDLIGKTIGVPDFFGSSYIGLLIFLNKY